MSSRKTKKLDARLSRSRNQHGRTKGVDVSVWRTNKNAATEQKKPFYSRGHKDWIITISVIVIIVSGVYVAYRMAENKQQGKSIKDLFKPKRESDGYLQTSNGAITTGGKVIVISVGVFVCLMIWYLFFTERGRNYKNGYKRKT